MLRGMEHHGILQLVFTHSWYVSTTDSTTLSNLRRPGTSWILVYFVSKDVVLMRTHGCAHSNRSMKSFVVFIRVVELHGRIHLYFGHR